MSGTNYLSLRTDAPSNTTSATVGSMGFSTLVGSTLSANTAALASSLSVSSLTTGFLGFSTLVGSSMSTNFITVQSTITASTLTASGNVGIGSAAPVQKLDVNGSASLSGTLYMADEQNLFIGANTNNAIRLHHTSNQTYLDYGSADLNIRSNDGSNVINDRIIVKQSGSVGIGTTNPNEKLHLNGNLTLGLAGAQAAYYFYPRPTYSSEIGQGDRSGGTLYGNTMDISSGYFQTAAWNGQFFSGVLNLRTGTQNDIGNNGTAGGTYQSGTMYLYTGDVVVRNDGGSAQTCIPGSIYFGTGKVVRNATGSDPGPDPIWRMVINGSTGNVGIGTDNPATSLHVVTSTTATTSGILSTRFYLDGPGDNQDTTGPNQDGPWYGLGWSGIPGLSGSPYVCLAGWSGVAMRSSSGFLQLTGAGSVGIGKTNPGSKLDVAGDIQTSNSILFGSSGSYTAGSIYSDTNWGMILRAKQSNPAIAEFMIANADDVRRLFINPSGNVGIATDSPTAARLQVAGRGLFGYVPNSKTGIFIDNEDSYGNAPCIQSVSNTFGASPMAINPVGGNVGIGTINPETSLHIARAVSANNDYSLMTYYENTYPSYHDWAIGPYIDGGAAFAIRSGSNNLPANLTNLFYIDGYGTAIRFPGYTTSGTLSINGAGGVISSSSDRRIKQDIVYQTDTADALARVLQLRPATFRFLNQESVHLGFIAQDVEQYIPLAVDGKKYEWKWKPDENGAPTFDADGNMIYQTDADGNRIIRPRGLEDRAIIAMQTLAIQQLAKENVTLQNHLVSLITWAKSHGYVPS